MKSMEEFMDELGLDNQIQLEDIPNIDLYMDQVIQLFETSFRDTKRNEKEKILTKTMINNYAKGHLFFPIKNKKYSKEHLIMISLIYQLKGALTINDIKNSLAGVNKRIMEEDFDPAVLYKSYLQISEKHVEYFKENLKFIEAEIEKEADHFEEKDRDYLKAFLYIVLLANMSNLYKRAAEKMVDKLTVKREK